MDIEYCQDAEISVELAIDLFRRSTLAERRPVDRPEVFAKMLANADLMITAWDGERLVGIARTLTDFGHAAYLADLAVDASYQGRGIGAELIRRTEAQLEEPAYLALLAAPQADGFYPKVGYERHPRAWFKPIANRATS